MDREKLFQHFEKHYTARRDLISRIPLGIDPDKLWQEVLDRRKARAVTLPLISPSGSHYWYVITQNMISASEKIIEEYLNADTDENPYQIQNPLAPLEEVFFTSDVEGSPMTMQEAMRFLQEGREPRDIQEQMIQNNRNAFSFASANLYRGIDALSLQNLVYLLTENMEPGGPEFRTEDSIPIPSMMNEPFLLPSAFSLQDRIRELSAFLADPSVHPLIKAGNAQAWVLLTRPFNEGNERLARILSSVVLLRAGYMFFGEVSFSSLIARQNYDYYNAIGNILRQENGNDLTYFLDYFLSLLARGIDERHLKQARQKQQVLEQERMMAAAPLASQAPAVEKPVESDTVMDGFSLLTLDAASNHESSDADKPDAAKGEIQAEEGGDLVHRGSYSDLVRRLKDAASDPETVMGKSAGLLYDFLTSGKLSFTCADLVQKIGISMEYAAKITFRFRSKNMIEAVGKDGRMTVYGFLYDRTERYDGSEESRKSMMEQGYTASLLDSVDELASSPNSFKDRRIAEVLQKCLPCGIITLDDYQNAGLEGKWSGDMSLVEQIGIVERIDTKKCRILKDLRNGPPALKPAQKEAVTAMYETFGDDLFSLEMVVATLDYSSSHASAMLHQFTLLKVLECRREEVNRYQFLITPAMYPECFTEAA